MSEKNEVLTLQELCIRSHADTVKWMREKKPLIRKRISLTSKKAGTTENRECVCVQTDIPIEDRAMMLLQEAFDNALPLECPVELTYTIFDTLVDDKLIHEFVEQITNAQIDLLLQYVGRLFVKIGVDPLRAKYLAEYILCERDGVIEHCNSFFKYPLHAPSVEI